jgi:hypothetical protein
MRKRNNGEVQIPMSEKELVGEESVVLMRLVCEGCCRASGIVFVRQNIMGRNR